MSFKINDYNAFLTSLFDKNNTESSNTTSNKQIKSIDPQMNQSPFGQKQTGGSFPVDFDFGLISNSYNKSSLYSPKLDEDLEDSNTNNNPPSNNPSNTTTATTFMINDLTQQANNSNSNINSVSPIILESDLSIPDQPFDLYNVNFNPQSQTVEQQQQQIDTINENIPNKNQPLSPLSNMYEEFDSSKFSLSPPIEKSKLKKIKSNDDSFIKQKFHTYNLEQSETPNLKNNNHRPRVKSAHNIIEQRYRNKINDKFTALQMSVPSLRVATRRKKKSLTDGDDDDDDESIFEFSPNPNGKLDAVEDLEGLEPARKLNKGTILTKSIEYIKFLELKNSKMKQEHEELLMKAKMLGLEIDSDLLDN